MSKNILEKLSEDLEQMHYNHEGISWMKLKHAIDKACSKEPQGVAEPEDNSWQAQALSLGKRLEALQSAYDINIKTMQALHYRVLGRTNSGTDPQAHSQMADALQDAMRNSSSSYQNLAVWRDETLKAVRQTLDCVTGELNTVTTDTVQSALEKVMNEHRRTVDGHIDSQAWRFKVIDHVKKLSDEMGIDSAPFDRTNPQLPFIRAEQINEFMSDMVDPDDEMTALRDWQSMVKHAIYAALRVSGLPTHVLKDNPSSVGGMSTILDMMTAKIIQDRQSLKEADVNTMLMLGDIVDFRKVYFPKSTVQPEEITTQNLRIFINDAKVVHDADAARIKELAGENERLNSALEEQAAEILGLRKNAIPKDGSHASWRKGVSEALVRAHFELVPGSVLSINNLDRVTTVTLIDNMTKAAKTKLATLAQEQNRNKLLGDQLADAKRELAAEKQTDTLILQLQNKLEQSGVIKPQPEPIKAGDRVWYGTMVGKGTPLTVLDVDVAQGQIYFAHKPQDPETLAEYVKVDESKIWPGDTIIWKGESSQKEYVVKEVFYDRGMLTLKGYSQEFNIHLCIKK